jgi:hypothetical protein
MIYHVLPESEPFSESRGGAIARRSANVLGEGQRVIVCSSEDASHGFDVMRVLALVRVTAEGDAKSRFTPALAGEP